MCDVGREGRGKGYWSEESESRTGEKLHICRISPSSVAPALP